MLNIDKVMLDASKAGNLSLSEALAIGAAVRFMTIHYTNEQEKRFREIYGSYCWDDLQKLGREVD